METLKDKGKIIGEFDLYDYGLPTNKGYLFHQLSHGGNDGDLYPKNREYLRIIGFDKDNKIIEYGYIYFMLYTSKEGLKTSSYIGSKVMDEYRGKGLGDLLMSIYLYYSYDNNFTLVESTTRQRKLDLLSLMNKYGFKVTKPSIYEDGERITMYKNNMVVDIYKEKKSGLYYKFKTKKAEDIYKRNNSKVSGNYQYLSSQDSKDDNINWNNYKKLGWVVPNEEYIINEGDSKEELVDNNLKKSGFSR